MAFVAADWSITRATGNIRYIGDAHTGAAPSYATGIELHRALQNFADDATDTGDDELSIIDQTPSDRGGADTNITLLNGYNIDDPSSEHLYDTSVTQAAGAEIYDGIQVFGNATSIQVIQDGARLVNDFWNQAKMVAAVADAVSSTSHRFLVKVRTAGADIDGRRLLGTQRVLGTVYSEFFIGGGTNRGNNTLALTANTDGNNATIAATIATWTDIVNSNEGYVGIDADGNTVNEFYYSNWTIGARTKNQLYERGKWIQREGTAETVYGLAGDIFRGITHEINIDTPTGTFVEPESLSWTGGTAQLLAIDSTTAGTKMWIQLLSGQAPADNVLITGAGGATCLVNITVTARLLSSTFIGTSTGTAINPAAYGLGILAGDLTVSDSLVDLTNTARNPPNNVIFSVNNLVSGDRVLVGPENGASGLRVDQIQVQTAKTITSATSIATSAGEASGVVVMASNTETIGTGQPSADDTPNSGSFRVYDNAGVPQRIAYTGYTAGAGILTFSGCSTTVAFTAAATNNGFISYIDLTTVLTAETFTSVFNSIRTLFIRVRNSTALIKTFESTGTLGSGGGSATTGRISDA